MRRNIAQSFQLAPITWEYATEMLLDRELGINVSQFDISQLDIKGNDGIVPNAHAKDERNDWRRYLLTMHYTATADLVAGGKEWIVTRLIPTVEFLRYNGGLESGTLGTTLSGAKTIGYNPYNLAGYGLIGEEDFYHMETVQDALDGIARIISERMSYNPIRNIMDADYDKKEPPFSGTVTTALWTNWQRKIRVPANKIRKETAPLHSAIFGFENEAMGGKHILVGGWQNKAAGAQSSLVTGERNCISNAISLFVTGSNNRVEGYTNNISILGSNNTVSGNIRNTVLLGDSLNAFASNLAAMRMLSVQDRVLLLGSLDSHTYDAYNSCKGRLLYVDGYTGEVDTAGGKKKLPTAAWTGGASGQILYWENEGIAPDIAAMPKYGPSNPAADQTVYWDAAGIQFGILPTASGGTGAGSLALTAPITYSYPSYSEEQPDRGEGNGSKTLQEVLQTVWENTKNLEDRKVSWHSVGDPADPAAANAEYERVAPLDEQGIIPMRYLEAETARAVGREDGIEANARQIDASDNANGSFTFTNYDGDTKIIPTGKKVKSTDNTIEVTEGTNDFDLSIQPALVVLNARMDSIENLGDYVGSFPTRASLPESASAFPNGITVNDFATIRADETNAGKVTRYVVTEISPGGAVTWIYDLTYSTDITMKADKVAGATSGNFAGLDGSGNLTDSGKKASDFATAAQGGKADAALQSITASNGLSVDPKSGTAQNVKGNAASTSAVGVVQLNNSTNSTLDTQAATPSAVKAAYDLASSKANRPTAGTGIAIGGTAPDVTITNTAPNVKSNWNAAAGTDGEILNKPTIPTVYDAALTVTQNGVSVGNNFTANSSAARTYAIVAPDWNAAVNAQGEIKNKPTVPSLPLSVANGGTNASTGYDALQNLISNSLYKTPLGYRALYYNTTGTFNTAIGSEALKENTTGSNNTAIGYCALLANTTGGGNTAIGSEALHANAGGNNTAVGFFALYANTTASGNTAIGYYTLRANTTGEFNTAIGYQALLANTTGHYNTAIGYQALRNTITFVDAYNNYIDIGNTAVGYRTLYNNTYGRFNTAIGYEALFSNTGTDGGDNNTAIGYEALYKNTNGGANTAIGIGALYNNTTASCNTAIGSSALYHNTTGIYNTAIGDCALYFNTTGSNNTAIGTNSGSAGSTTSNPYDNISNSVFVGYNTSPGGNGRINQIVIGYQAEGKGTNTIQLGNGSISAIYCQQTSITFGSDIRLKEDVQPANLNLCVEAVKNLPVNRYKYKDFTGAHNDKHVTGFLADDVEKIFPKAVSKLDRTFPVLDENGEVEKEIFLEDVKHITMTEATPTLWGAMQKLIERVEILEAKQQELL